MEKIKNFLIVVVIACLVFAYFASDEKVIGNSDKEDSPSKISKNELCRYVISTHGSATPDEITIKLDGSGAPYGYYNRKSDGKLFAYACSNTGNSAYLSELPEWNLLKNTEYKYKYDGEKLTVEFWQHGQYISKDTYDVKGDPQSVTQSAPQTPSE